MRGNLALERRVAAIRGSIPACAGEPSALGSDSINTKVYPRVCGGTTPLMVPEANWKGLSPRVRGNRARNSSSVSMVGSIPACAGEPLLLYLYGLMKRVYPRVCGGTRVNAVG